MADKIELLDPTAKHNLETVIDIKNPHGTEDKVPSTFALAYLLNDQCREVYIDGYSRNFLEFYSFKYRRFNQISAGTELELFEKALGKGYTKLLVIKQGNILQDFIEIFRDEYREKWSGVTLAGHILDRGDQYWQLHPQLFYIDLDWWVQAGKPNFGVRDINNPEQYEAVTPVRSTETLVEGEWYNPVGVSPGTETKTYCGQWEGGELLRAVFADPLAVTEPWPERLRKHKSYLYPEMPDFWEENHNISRIFMETTSWYVANNEPIHRVESVKNLKVLVSTSAGPIPWINAYINKLSPKGIIKIMDICGLGVGMQHQVFNEWDGVDWEAYINGIIEHNPIMNRTMFRSQQHLKNQSDQIKQIPGFTEWWQSDERRNLRVQYQKVDFINFKNVIRQLQDLIDRNLSDDEMMMVDLSNAFNYEYTNLLADLESRIKIEDEYLLFFLHNRKQIFWKTIMLDDVYRTTSMRDLFPWSPKRDV